MTGADTRVGDADVSGRSEGGEELAGAEDIAGAEFIASAVTIASVGLNL